MMAATTSAQPSRRLPRPPIPYIEAPRGRTPRLRLAGFRNIFYRLLVILIHTDIGRLWRYYSLLFDGLAIHRYNLSMASNLIEEFWRSPPKLPDGLKLSRLERMISSRPGPGGQEVHDLVELLWSKGRVRLLLGYKTPLLARDVPKIHARLVESGRNFQRLSTDRSQAAPLSAVVTDAASPSVIEASTSEGLSIFDQRGTAIVRGPGVFIHVLGRGKAPLAPLARGGGFRGVPGRVARVLLAEPNVPRTAQEMATLVDAGYSTTYNALARLEREGFAERRSPRTGFFLRDPIRLLRKWMESGEWTASAVESYYAPDVTVEALARAQKALSDRGIKGIWSLASAVMPDDLHVSGLPHGIYLSGSVEPLKRTLRLRRVTPHNFLVLRCEPAAETSAGGVYMRPRALPHGPGVSLAQLIIDCAGIGGRGREQAEFLLNRYAALIRRGES